VELDVGLIRQVLSNLGRNALQAMPEGGTLEFLTMVRDNRVVLEVIDTGLGMDERTRQKMFRAFFSTRSGGSGLGLPTVRRIIEAHHGSIACESEEGRGTRFTVTLPFTAGETDTDRQSVADSESAAGDESAAVSEPAEVTDTARAPETGKTSKTRAATEPFED
jgi:signal transduction histidine kinase